MARKKDQSKRDAATEIMDKLNTLALNVLDDLLEKRRARKTVSLEEVKVPLLTIKEIKDLCKINAKIKDSSFGGFFDSNAEEEDDLSGLDSDKILSLTELEAKEKEIEGELYESKKGRKPRKDDF